MCVCVCAIYTYANIYIFSPSLLTTPCATFWDNSYFSVELQCLSSSFYHRILLESRVVKRKNKVRSIYFICTVYFTEKEFLAGFVFPQFFFLFLLYLLLSNIILHFIKMNFSTSPNIPTPLLRKSKSTPVLTKFHLL